MISPVTTARRGVLVLGLALLAAFAAAGQGSAQPAPGATPTPSAALPTLAPLVPGQPLPTLAPADARVRPPYPAYGTPAPGQSPVAEAGVPQTVTLQQAIAIAVARSPVLAAARADQALAAAPLKAARSAFFPNISGTASSTRNFRQQPASSSSAASGGSANGSGSGSGSASGNTSFAGPSTTNALGASLRQLIFDGGKIFDQLHSAQAGSVAAIYTYRRQLETVSFNVANAYYNALAAQRTTAVALETVNLNQVQVNLVTAQFRAGAAARTDIATAELPLAQARLAVVRAQGTELASYAQFANAMGLDANVDVRPADDSRSFNFNTITTIEIPPYARALDRAYALRPDYTASQRLVDQTTYSLRAARLGMFSTLNGTASTQTVSTDASGGTFRNAGSIGVALSVPIFDQGLTAFNVAQAQANLDKANANLQITRQGIQLAVKQGLIGLISARAGIDQANAELVKAAEVLRATQAQYKAGVTTLPLLLNAQVQYTQALTDQTNALYALRQAEQAYLLSTGELQ